MQNVCFVEKPTNAWRMLKQNSKRGGGYHNDQAQEGNDNEEEDEEDEEEWDTERLVASSTMSVGPDGEVTTVVHKALAPNPPKAEERTPTKKLRE